MSNVMTIGDLLTAQAAREKGVQTQADNETERRVASTARHQAKLRKAEHDRKSRNRTDERRDSSVAYKGGKGYNPLTAKVKGTTATTRPALTVDRETGELKATDASTFKRKKMTQAEFNGSKMKQDKLYEKDSSGKWVHNCAAARTYRQQVWNHFNWRKADLSEQPEHPDAMAVQLTGV
ncbi:hypothetical protein OAA43_00295 [bacterium]|nr:hypothetical protein [bacterium]